MLNATLRQFSNTVPMVSGIWDDWVVPKSAWTSLMTCFSYPAINLSSNLTKEELAIFFFVSNQTLDYNHDRWQLFLWWVNLQCNFLGNHSRCLYLGFPRFKMDNWKKKTANFTTQGTLDTTTSLSATFKGFKNSLRVLGFEQ